MHIILYRGKNLKNKVNSINKKSPDYLGKIFYFLAFFMLEIIICSCAG